MDALTSLPLDVFLLIISYLSPADTIRCRRVSRSWNAVFTDDDISRNLMRWHFPRAREMRNAVPGTLGRPGYARMFPEVARRYLHLRAARPRMMEKIVIDAAMRQESHFYEVEPWNRQLRRNGKSSPFQYRDASWCFDDGLLVCRVSDASGYLAYDLETGHITLVPFDGADRTVRRVRLAHGILLIEWCERERCCLSSSGAAIHRHFATVYDVQRPTESGPSAGWGAGPWQIRFRSEWKLDDLGLPLNRRDRFFSAHTATHYVLYVWNHPATTHDSEEPVEELKIWRIDDACAYRPSDDPTGAGMPDAAQPQPRLTRVLGRGDLRALGIRQGKKPMLREILLDEANVYFHEEKHMWLVASRVPYPPPRHHSVRSTGIPLSGIGPRWVDECCADGGKIHLTFCPRAAAGAGSAALHGHGGWPGYAPCWRHDAFPYLTVSSVVDAQAGVRFAARRCSMIEAVSSFVRPKISVSAEADGMLEMDLADDIWTHLLAKGKIAGDERWVVGEGEDGNISIARF
ncbi:hypothetical protein F5Y14DRAFT_411519 [Nemania sp. NC0429]|nr:hypothetical protein F5Y14DRAFT_411519 [Nemania sp. NC0429]